MGFGWKGGEGRTTVYGCYDELFACAEREAGEACWWVVGELWRGWRGEEGGLFYRVLLTWYDEKREEMEEKRKGRGE